MAEEEAPRAPSAEERRTARANWPIRKFRLGEEPVDDYSAYTMAERMMMVERMTNDAWASAGRPIPRYSRREMPVRVIRKGATGKNERE